MLEITEKHTAFRLHRCLPVLLCVVLGFRLAPAGESALEKLDVIRRVMGERGEYDLAERQLQSFIEENRGGSHVAEALVLLGYCQDKQKKNEAAALTYARVLSSSPPAADPLKVDAALGAADANFRLGRFGEAVRYYTTVLEIRGKPDQNEAALLWRGEAHYRLGLGARDSGADAGGHLRDALADFVSFINTHPESKQLPSAVSGAAFAAFDAGKLAEALGFFQRFAKEFPSDRRVEECRYFTGDCLYRLGRYDEAKIAFRQLIDSNPSGSFAAEARSGEAWSDYGLGKVAEAAAGFEDAAAMADREDQKLSFLYDAGCAWREAGEAQKAAPPLLEVAKAAGHELNSLAWFRLGTLWQEQARAARLRTENAAAATDRERFAALQKKLGEESVQYFRRALAKGDLGDEEMEARSLLGEVLLDAGRLGEAAETFEDIAARWPGTDRAAWARYHQALVERELAGAAGDEAVSRGHLAKAAEALRESLKNPRGKTRLQAVWALADYLALLGEQDGSREQFRWLASEGEGWARDWKDERGAGDPSLEGRAREYAVDSLFRLGDSYYFANDYPRASGFYEEIITKYPDAPQASMAYLRQGEIAEAGQDSGAARSRYEESLKLGLRLGKSRVGSTLAYAQLRLGTLLLRQGQAEGNEAEKKRLLQEAGRNLAAVLSDPPSGLNPARPYYYLAEVKYNLDQKKEALADYEASIRADASGELSDAAWFGVAWVKRDFGDNKGAVEAARRVVDDFSGSALRPDAFALMAAVRRADGDPDGALADLERFLGEYADHPLAAKAELERASAMDEMGRHAEAAEAFQKFLSEHPNHPDVPQALYQRSWALWNRIRPRAQKARELEARLQALRPAGGTEAVPAEALAAEDELRGLNAELRKSEDEILAALRGLAERYPDYPVVDAAWLRIGEILYDRAEYQQALAAYQKAHSVAEARGSELADKAQYRLAWSIQRLAEASERTSLTDPDPKKRDSARKDMWDRRVAAIDAFETILGHYPKSELVGEACFRAAELRRQSGQDNIGAGKRSAWFESAVKRYEQALEKGGAEASYRQAAENGRGMSLLLDNKPQEAREVFRRLLLNPDGPYVQEAYWGLGQANLNLGAYADAAAAFEQALGVDKTSETAAKSRFGLGVTAAQAGDPAKARLEFLAVDTLYPNYPEWAAAALVRAAKSAKEEGLRDKAIGDLERVLARYGDTLAAEEARELQAKITAGE